MFAAVARIDESGPEELISESVIKGSLLLLSIICWMISFGRLFRSRLDGRWITYLTIHKRCTAKSHSIPNSLLGLI